MSMLQRPLSYLGILDDFALKYDDGAIRSVEELNKHLILATLFSDPLLVNDGYLLSHAAIRDALINPNASPLKQLVECGYVKILSRNQRNLGNLAKWMADLGISSAKSLLNDERFLTEFQPILQNWSDELQLPAYDAFRDWPNIKVDEVFQKVSKDTLSALVKSSESTTVLFESDTGPKRELLEFGRQLSESRGRRTEWEDIGLRMLQEGSISRITFISLMKAANESYQYSWGCALAKDIGSVRVLTRMPQHLAKFELSEITVPEIPKSPVTIAVPNAAFAIRSVDGKWERLADVVTAGRELNVLKHKFLDALRTYYQSPDSNAEELSRLGKEYTTALSKHFGNTIGVNVVFDLTFVGVSTAAGAMIAGPPGMIAGAALSVTGVAASHLGAPKLLWRLNAPSPKKWLVDRNVLDTRDLVSAFQIDRSVASQYTDGIPPFQS